MRGFEVPISAAGAVLHLQLGIGDLRRKALIRAGHTPPAPIPVTFLVDTGASCSWVDEMHMRTFGLDPRSWGEVHDLRGKGIARDFNAYEASLVMGGVSTANSRRFEVLIGGQSFDNQPFDGLLGRDVLNQCQLGWRGPARWLRIDYE